MPFKKGQSGNPKGRPPKGYSIADMFKQMLDTEPDLKRAFANKVFEKAIKDKDVAAMKLVIQYTDGMPLQAVDLTSKGEQLQGPVVYVPQEKDE